MKLKNVVYHLTLGGLDRACFIACVHHKAYFFLGNCVSVLGGVAGCGSRYFGCKAAYQGKGLHQHIYELNGRSAADCKAVGILDKLLRNASAKNFGGKHRAEDYKQLGDDECGERHSLSREKTCKAAVKRRKKCPFGSYGENCCIKYAVCGESGDKLAWVRKEPVKQTLAALFVFKAFYLSVAYLGAGGFTAGEERPYKNKHDADDDTCGKTAAIGSAVHNSGYNITPVRIHNRLPFRTRLYTSR